MTLAKTGHASNVMQDLEKVTYSPIAKPAFWIAMFQCSVVVLKKMNLISKLKVAMLNE